MIVDSHGHIYGDRFAEDRAAVVERAVQAGVRHLMQVGCNLEESRQVVALAERAAGVYASVGVHPHDADQVDEAVLTGLRALTEHPKVLAWGEIGLDYYYDNSPRETQRRGFAAQLRQAVELDLPIVVHTRDAEEDTLRILRDDPPARGGHIHCFTGTAPMAEALVEMGFHIGFTGIITFKNADALREVVAATAIDRLLVETDCPYLAPVPNRGKRNEPSYVVHVAEAVARIKGLSYEEVARATTENFYRVYGRTGVEWEPLGELTAV
jgi:TatD DNase family protein